MQFRPRQANSSKDRIPKLEMFQKPHIDQVKSVKSEILRVPLGHCPQWELW